MAAPRGCDRGSTRREGAAIVAGTTARPARVSSRADAGIELAGFALLLVLSVAAIVSRPGALLEVATIGVAAAATWAAAASAAVRRSIVVVAALALATCLTDTWPGRGWTLAIGHLPAGVDAVFAPATILTALAFVLTRGDQRPSRPPASLRVGAILLVVGAVISTAIAGRAAPAGAALLAFVVPIAAAALVMRLAPRLEESWVILTGLLAGICVPAIVGIAAYVLQIGFPTSAAALARGKEILVEPLLFQQLTFGNVDHFSVLVVLLLPAAVLGAVRPAAPLVQRAVAATAVAALIAIVLLVLSRLALAASVAEVALLTALLVVRRERAASTAVAVLTGCLLLLFASPSIRREFAGSAAATTAASTPAAGSPAPAPVPAPVVPGSGVGPSATFRESAVRTGLHVFRKHAPFGVGTGRYPLYDPVHTAPHSLVVELLAENGVLALVGLLAIASYIVAAFVRLLRSPPRELGTFELQLACLLGAGTFLAVAAVGGTALVNGYTDVWPMVLGLLVALSLPRTHGADDEPA